MLDVWGDKLAISPVHSLVTRAQGEFAKITFINPWSPHIIYQIHRPRSFRGPHLQPIIFHPPQQANPKLPHADAATNLLSLSIFLVKQKHVKSNKRTSNRL